MTLSRRLSLVACSLFLLLCTGCWSTEAEVIGEKDATPLPYAKAEGMLEGEPVAIGKPAEGGWYPYKRGHEETGRFRVMRIHGDYHALLSQQTGKKGFLITLHRIGPDFIGKDLEIKDAPMLQTLAKAHHVEFREDALVGTAQDQLAFLKSLKEFFAQ